MLPALATPAHAYDGVYLPQSPNGPGGDDSIDTADGTRCRQSMSNNGAYVDMGVIGTATRQPRQPSVASLLERQGDSAVAYARITIPIGTRPGRLDCSRLYELELQRLRREVELLRMGAQ